MHYHTPDLVAPAHAAMAAAAAHAGVDLDFVIVDNGSEPAGRAQLEGVPGARVLDRGQNLGYAGGANLGFERSDGELVAVMNPDVVADERCIAHLLEALQAGAGCVGPRFSWDREGVIWMPPSDARGFGQELRRAQSGWSRRHRLRARVAWRAHAQRHWCAKAPIPSRSLSGALLLFRRDAWRRVGPFDEGYRLYFEETDWLERAAAAGVETRYVPAARAVHYYDQSASGEPASRGWFEESAARFRARAYGRARSRVLAAAERLNRAPEGDTLPRIVLASAADDPPVSHEARWLELSPDRRGYPAVAQRFEDGVPLDWSLPRDVRERHPDLYLHGRLVDDDQRELATFDLPPEAGEGAGS